MRHATTRAVQLAALAAVVLAAGCSQKKRTEVVVGLATDLTAPMPLASVFLEAVVLPHNVTAGDREVRNISGDPAHPYTIPGTYAIYSEAGTADRVRVTLTAVDNNGTMIVVRTALFSLVPEKTLFVRLGVVSACIGMIDCGDGLTCINGRCVPETIDSSTLPEYQSGAENELSCASMVTYVNTSTKQALMQGATQCASGLCSEGVCLMPRPGAAGGTGGTVGMGGQGGQGGQGGVPGAGGESDGIPQLTTVVPASGTAGTPVTLEVHGQGIGDGWIIVFDGNAVPTTITQGSDGPIATTTLNIPTDIATGQVPVWLEKGALATNTLYFTVMPAAGAPTIVDYTPDNALPGTTISIVGTNLISEPVTITDPVGRPMPVLAMGTTSWVSGVAVDRVDVAVPSDMVTGALTAANTQGSFRGRIFNVGQNLSLLPGVVATSSTQYNTTTWSRMSGYDNNLQTSFFTAHGDCVGSTSCTTVPYFQLTFPAPQTVARIAMRGNREYASGYDFIEGRFDILDANGALLWSEDRLLPDPDRDLDILVEPRVSNASAVRFTSISDQPDEPGFSELEVFAD